jgi:hypothetical protein
VSPIMTCVLFNTVGRLHARRGRSAQSGTDAILPGIGHVQVLNWRSFAQQRVRSSSSVSLRVLMSA